MNTPRPAPAADPREFSASFAALPPEVQDEVRLGWRENDARDERVDRISKSERKGGMLEALALVGLPELCTYGFNGLHLIASAVLAALIGEAWWRCRAGQIATPVIAALGYAALQSIWICTGRSTLFALFCNCAFVAFAAAYLGLRREQRTIE